MHRTLGITAILMFISALGLYFVSKHVGWPLAPLPWWLMPLAALIALGLGVDIAYGVWAERERQARRKAKRNRVAVVSIVLASLIFALSSVTSAADINITTIPDLVLHRDELHIMVGEAQATGVESGTFVLARGTEKAGIVSGIARARVKLFSVSTKETSLVESKGFGLNDRQALWSAFRALLEKLTEIRDRKKE